MAGRRDLRLISKAIEPIDKSILSYRPQLVPADGSAR